MGVSQQDIYLHSLRSCVAPPMQQRWSFNSHTKPHRIDGLKYSPHNIETRVLPSRGQYINCLIAAARAAAAARNLISSSVWPRAAAKAARFCSMSYRNALRSTGTRSVVRQLPSDSPSASQREEKSQPVCGATNCARQLMWQHTGITLNDPGYKD